MLNDTHVVYIPGPGRVVDHAKSTRPLMITHDINYGVANLFSWLCIEMYCRQVVPPVF